MKQTENLLAGYHAKLAQLEAAIHAIDPELPLAGRHRTRNTVFDRGEFTRLILEILRDAPEPMPMRAIAVRMLAVKGHHMPDPKLRKQTYQRLSQALAVHHGRGTLEMLGTPNRRVWRLV